MSNNGGARYGADEPTSFGLQPPHPQPPVQAPPAGVPHPGNPYATPAQAVPPQQPGQIPAPVAQPAHAAHDPGAGRLIAGRYRLLAKLGHGGMGTVWRAKDETVDREVAVKEPRVPDHLPEREQANAFERMRREARAAARLDHPAVVNVHDVAVVDGRPWIVMELVQGRSLGAALQEGTLGAREAARIGLEVLGALEAAHAAGILHRDVKPDNVLLGRHDRVVLTDFGIAQIEGETNLTDTGGFVGSPEYIAPERVLGQRPGPASDLWSLGVVLYAATEGVSPFRRSNTPATLQSVLNAHPAPPASAQGPLAEVINGLLQKDPAHRPGAARVRALLEAAANPPVPAPTQVVTVTGGGDRGGIRLGRKALLGIGAAVVAVAVAGWFAIARPFTDPSAEGWEEQQAKELAATLSVPTGYQRSGPGPTDPKDDHWVRYTDPSGAVYIRLELSKKSEDTLDAIASTPTGQAYDEKEELEGGTSSAYNIADDKPVEVETEKTTYQGREAAESTLTYTDDTVSDFLVPREVKIFYVRTEKGDMYRLSVSYPGRGDFTERGREVAEHVIDSVDIDNL
ncbi:serine/threonine-protein kinase [Streptomyces sp. NPDC053367]|uniref:serine/threonine-protein kinase n=1 Tax=Streptomyces sp. NPDC053367 TaxID=3365700 RepID=UPI0037D4DD07